MHRYKNAYHVITRIKKQIDYVKTILILNANMKNVIDQQNYRKIKKLGKLYFEKY